MGVLYMQQFSSYLFSYFFTGLVKVIQEIMYSGCPVYATGLLFAFAPIWILLVVLNVMTHKELRRHSIATAHFKFKHQGTFEFQFQAQKNNH